MGTSDTLRSVIDAGRSSKRLDELSSARVIAKTARQLYAAQQKAGAGKAVGPVTPVHIKLLESGDVKLELGGGSTLGYSSPEQIQGGARDRRSDVFSLGAVLWELLTYTRPFDAMNDAAVKAAVLDREIAPPSQVNANVPAELSAICMRALSRNPADRYQSLKAMAVELEEFLEEAGYEDSDAKIASYLATLRGAQNAPADTQPPPAAMKRPATPTLLGQPPKPERAKTPSGAAIAAALANASTSSSGSSAGAADSALPPAQPTVTAIGVPKLTDWQDTSTPTHAPPPAAAPVVSVEQPEPASVANMPNAPSAPKASSAPSAPNASNEPEAPKATSTPSTSATAGATSVPTVPLPPVLPPGSGSTSERSSKAATTTAENAKAGVDGKASDAGAAKLVDDKQPEPAAARTTSQSDAVPSAAATSTSAPHPAAAVSLGPIPGGRESKDVLAGWGWGTDKHEALTEGYGDDEYEGAEPDTRKTLTYLIGGGLALAALVTFIALAFGSSSDGANDEKAVAKTTETARPAIDQVASPSSEPGAIGTQPAPGAVTGASIGATTADAVESATGSADPALAQGSAAGADGTAAAEEAEAERLAAEKAEAERLAAEKAETERLAAEEAAAKKAEAERLAAERAQARKEKAARLAAERAQAKKERAAKASRKAAPKRVARAEPNVDVQAAYRTGLQRFARGDTRGALASLRTARAANPSYAPTWRGLGLVYEKLGQKAQARAAYKRYLQLAPRASDADQIRARLGRLGS